MTLDDFYKNSIGKNLFREDLLWYKLGLVKQLEKYVAWIEANDNLPKWATKMHNDEHAYVDFSIGSFFSYCGAEFYGADLRVRQFNLLKNKIVYSFDCIYADMHVQPVPDKTIYYVPIYDESVQGVLTNEQIKNNTGLDLDTIHKIDCTDSSWIDEVKTARYFQSFSAKEIKYDKVYNYQDGTFAYDHVANECYYCVVNPNYSNILKTAIDKVRKKESIDGDITTELNKLGITDDVQGFVQKLVKAQLIADGTIKNNTFKSISATTNYGINTYNAIQKNDDDGNDLFTGYHPSTITTLSDQIVDAKSINGKSFNGIMNDYVGNNKCYEIDITIQLYNPGAKEFSNPFIYFNLGNETCTTKITHTKLNEGDYLIKFTEPSQWKVGSDYKFQLTNPSSNYKWDSVTKTNYESVITGGNIKLKSITFKYK